MAGLPQSSEACGGIRKGAARSHASPDTPRQRPQGEKRLVHPARQGTPSLPLADKRIADSMQMEQHASTERERERERCLAVRLAARVCCMYVWVEKKRRKARREGRFTGPINGMLIHIQLGALRTLSCLHMSLPTAIIAKTTNPVPSPIPSSSYYRWRY